MSFLPKSNKAGLLAGIYLVNAVVAPLAIFYNVGAPSSSSARDMGVTSSLTNPIHSGPLPTVRAQRSALLPPPSCRAHSLSVTLLALRLFKPRMLPTFAPPSWLSWAHRPVVLSPPCCFSCTMCGPTSVATIKAKRRRSNTSPQKFGPPLPTGKISNSAIPTK